MKSNIKFQAFKNNFRLINREVDNPLYIESNVRGEIIDELQITAKITSREECDRVINLLLVAGESFKSKG